jgi:hypothetical protein
VRSGCSAQPGGLPYTKNTKNTTPSNKMPGSRLALACILAAHGPGVFAAPRGHLEPLGSHKGPRGKVEELDRWPTSKELFDTYMSKPLQDFIPNLEDVRPGSYGPASRRDPGGSNSCARLASVCVLVPPPPCQWERWAPGAPAVASAAHQHSRVAGRQAHGQARPHKRCCEEHAGLGPMEH